MTNRSSHIPTLTNMAMVISAGMLARMRRDQRNWGAATLQIIKPQNDQA
jgi:hypothetical protein